MADVSKVNLPNFKHSCIPFVGSFQTCVFFLASYLPCNIFPHKVARAGASDTQIFITNKLECIAFFKRALVLKKKTKTMSSVELIIIIITCTVLHQFVDTLQTVHVCFFKWLSIVAIPIIFSVLFILCLFILLSVTYPRPQGFAWSKHGNLVVVC